MAFYNRYVGMDDVHQNSIKEWEKAYLYLLKKLTFFWKGKRLILKNPSNTARIKLLLGIFPNAKFIHIYRNPYNVFFSMLKFMIKVLPRYCVQNPIKKEEMEEMIFDVYSRLYKKYFEEKALIPEKNLVEVRYENFIQQPLNELERIYGGLGLEGFEDNKKAFEDYIVTQSRIKTSKYNPDKEIKEKIYNNWKFAFDKLGYGA